VPLEFNPLTGKISLDGREVGEYKVVDGKAQVRLDLTYECSPEEWVIPLSWFDNGLHRLQKYRPPETSLQIKTSEDSIAEVFDVVRLLTEKTVKRSGYIWQFHKLDADIWPSPLHGHDYDKALKLDAITGDIYDVGSRQICKRLRLIDLKAIQDELRGSKDFRGRVLMLIDGVGNGVYQPPDHILCVDNSRLVSEFEIPLMSRMRCSA
jgi:hypothetical protein